ncbi:MAG: hypothetical protein KF691_13095 [Phycisphaeraceae bacterium]|nr:hypothetical protein [Phycisphaeraceae bacterium]
MKPDGFQMEIEKTVGSSPERATIKAAELKRRLESVPDDWDVLFADGLEFFRFKRRGETLIQIEFNQNVFKDEHGKWHVQY